MTAGAWSVERLVGTAQTLHDLTPEPPWSRTVRVLEATGPAVVLGSAQRPDAVDRARAEAGGIDVARRNSGGGAVWVAPGDLTWIDVFLPRGDPLWDDDVGRSTHWLGRVFADALAPFGVDGTVHTGPMERGPWSDLVCFAGVGPGEVMVGRAKVVGISQRRSRVGARFQCAVPHRWDDLLLDAFLGLLHPRPPTPDLRGVTYAALVPPRDLLESLRLTLNRRELP